MFFGASGMGKKKNFSTYKRRGEWVELIFMMRAAELEFNVSKPWGDSSRYDVSVEDGGRFRRVQVKSTDVARGDGGYICYLKRNGDSLLPDRRRGLFCNLCAGEEDVVYSAGAGGAAVEEQHSRGSGNEEAEVCAL